MPNPPETRLALTSRIKRLALDVGFSVARVAAAEPLHNDGERLQAWLDEGRQADMGWFTERYVDGCVSPNTHVTDVRSVLSVGLSYWHGPRPAQGRRGKVARYAWGSDYHTTMGERLEILADTLRTEFRGEHRWFVDAGPMLDRAWARRSGLGWLGKNTTIISPEYGSFLMLGELLTTLELTPDPVTPGSCGACRLCQVSCPTGALGPDFSLDSRKCISYLTIEHRGPIPIELRPLMGAWVFGCDICQDVCPPAVAPYVRTTEDRKRWAESARIEQGNGTSSLPFGAEQTSDSNPLYAGRSVPDIDLKWMLTLSHEEYLSAFRGTAVRRAKVWMLRRNAAVALGNVGDRESTEALVCALADGHPIVRGHAAWALGRQHARLDVTVAPYLAAALQDESDPNARAEIVAALGAMPHPTL